MTPNVNNIEQSGILRFERTNARKLHNRIQMKENCTLFRFIAYRNFIIILTIDQFTCSCS